MMPVITTLLIISILLNAVQAWKPNESAPQPEPGPNWNEETQRFQYYMAKLGYTNKEALEFLKEYKTLQELIEVNKKMYNSLMAKI